MTGKDQLQPALQVVGFHVDGASPSPGPHPSMLQGSPTPVIIPPAFQRETSAGRGNTASEAAAARAAAGADANGTSAAGAAPSAPQTTQPVPTTPAAGGPSSSSRSVSASVTSAPRPIHQSDKAGASHAGLPKTGSQHSVPSEASPMSSASGMFSLDVSLKHTPTRTALPASPRQKPQQPAQQPKEPPGGGDDDKPRATKPQKEMTKAERRALQESQRAAKAAQKGEPPAAADKGKGAGPSLKAESSEGKAGSKAPSSVDSRASTSKSAFAAVGRAGDADRRLEGGSAGGTAAGPAPLAPMSSGQGGQPPAPKKKDPRAVSLNSTELFAHLQQYRRINVSSLLQQPFVSGIHPAVLQLGLRYADGSIKGANARCLAMLTAMRQVIEHYTTPDGKDLQRDLQRCFNDHVNFLVLCRPMSNSMGNFVRYFKLRISHLSRDLSDAEAKEQLDQDIADYINARIHAADNLLVKFAKQKIEQSGDVILTYAASYVVQRVLIEAAMEGKRFRVVVMDARPELEGRMTLQKLLAAGIPCTYVNINASSYIIREVTKVFLGAAAVLSNGTVSSRAGSAAVAMMAHAHSKPVMILCESHKFTERVQLDSITHNELGDPEALATVPGRPEADTLKGWHEHARLRLLNLRYDVMPAEYVTMIVSEFGMVPATSVPAILREFAKQEGNAQGQF